MLKNSFHNLQAQLDKLKQFLLKLIDMLTNAINIMKNIVKQLEF